MPIDVAAVITTTIIIAAIAIAITFNPCASIRSEHYSRNEDENANGNGDTITKATARSGRRWHWWSNCGHEGLKKEIEQEVEKSVGFEKRGDKRGLRVRGKKINRMGTSELMFNDYCIKEKFKKAGQHLW